MSSYLLQVWSAICELRVLQIKNTDGFKHGSQKLPSKAQESIQINQALPIHGPMEFWSHSIPRSKRPASIGWYSQKYDPKYWQWRFPQVKVINVSNLVHIASRSGWNLTNKPHTENPFHSWSLWVLRLGLGSWRLRMKTVTHTQPREVSMHFTIVVHRQQAVSPSDATKGSRRFILE